MSSQWEDSRRRRPDSSGLQKAIPEGINSSAGLPETIPEGGCRSGLLAWRRVPLRAAQPRSTAAATQERGACGWFESHGRNPRVGGTGPVELGSGRVGHENRPAKSADAMAAAAARRLRREARRWRREAAGRRGREMVCAREAASAKARMSCSI
eukprot:scaffold2274_cov82-Isochrysis_galbana.AAC.1